MGSAEVMERPITLQEWLGIVVMTKQTYLHSQKRQWDRTRQLRLKAYHHLYRLFRVDQEICYYCSDSKANTLDHCPSLLKVALLGVEYFRRRRISFILVPACMPCNNDVGGGFYRRGHFVQLDYRRFLKGRSKS